MIRLRDLPELIWPRLQPFTAKEKREAEERFDSDKNQIASLDLSKDGNVALDEARRFADAEEARRRAADQKATTYLAVVAALVPLILTLASAVWDKKAGPAPTWLNMIVLAIAIMYIAAAAYWAFRVLEVATVTRIGATDIHRAWLRPRPSEKLTRHIILCARTNQAGVNQKVSSIKMSHAYLLRAVFVFSGLLLLNIVWYIGSTLAATFAVSEDPWMASASNALQAQAKVERIQQALTREPPSRVLGSSCAQSQGRLEQRIVADHPLSPAAPVRAALGATRDEHVSFRAVQLRCGDFIVADQKIWKRRLNLHERRARPKEDRRAPAVIRFWPPQAGDAPARLPDVILRQRMWTSVPGGGERVVTETFVRREALGRPRR